MTAADLPTELHLVNPRQVLGQVYLDWTPQPGSCLDHQGQTYTVLERRHRYQLRSGRYQLNKIALYLQTAPQDGDRQLLNGAWIIGDSSCRFNAHSPILRCAVNPAGPCQDCPYYQTKP
ncbi:DUF6464 family protein [Synechococcus sp. PCC 6312]|uniref:DUF6464 family protein n=1 Tax=Synechococcus sp. (strain ATCC 27167 / PCC 6312) TaxID=195253 RepID=UPI00029F4831|nr:DUF6464 family protein [Synechococcus sp. PCC 6312]AFY61788.1 hypothetical protein Syn6312_2701 [Synechococcus sp. PCC 6312]